VAWNVDKELFENAWHEMAGVVHRTSISKGWWEDCVPGTKDILYRIALIHSELGEGTEYTRKGNPPSEHIPTYSGLEEEFADVVIRIMDIAMWYGMDVEGAIASKVDFNRTRPYKHGKEA